tara:strand:- start:65 stop:376 length:312 start_codon:yes stop_codon:yes gene_type:complete
MKNYTIKIHEDDAERIFMLKMEMQQDDGNEDWDMICDIFQQIENQRFEEIMRKKKISIAEQGLRKEMWICKACGKSTYETEYDYLAARNMHLECALKEEMKNE